MLVAPGQESDWLGATNDIRLVLAQRLGIESAQDAERVHTAAFQELPEEETSREQWYRGDGARLRHDHLVAGITGIRAVRGHRARIVSRCE